MKTGCRTSALQRGKALEVDATPPAPTDPELPIHRVGESGARVPSVMRTGLVKGRQCLCPAPSPAPRAAVQRRVFFPQMTTPVSSAVLRGISHPLLTSHPRETTARPVRAELWDEPALRAASNRSRGNRGAGQPLRAFGTRPSCQGGANTCPHDVWWGPRGREDAAATAQPGPAEAEEGAMPQPLPQAT